MTKYEEGRKKVKTLLSNLKRNTSGLRKGNKNSKIAYLKGVLDEVKTHIPKGKKSKRKFNSDNFMGSYGDYDPLGNGKKKGKNNNPFGF